jgi:hypothetical protein
MTDPLAGPGDDVEDAFPWSSSRRRIVSLILGFHLFCVVLAPLAIVEPRPGLAVDIQRVLRPYSEFLYLIHGYRFFAPEPGPSHIVQYEIGGQSGEAMSGRFPDRQRHWPRLLYHRWFMLSETVYRHVSETLSTRELRQWQGEVRQQITDLLETDPRAAADMEARLQQEMAEHDRLAAIRDRLVSRLGKNLLRIHGGQSVDLKLVTRVIPPPQDIESGIRLDHPRYLPDELTYQLGRVYADSDTLESITPQEESGEAGNQADASAEDGQGRGGKTD